VKGVAELLERRLRATIPAVRGAGAGRGERQRQLLLHFQVLLGLLQGEVTALYPHLAAAVQTVTTHGAVLWKKEGEEAHSDWY
jgi:hypothetical protein